MFDGTWTIDRFIELAKTCSQESDGQEGMTAGDTWGVTLHTGGHFAQLMYGCGFRLSNMQSSPSSFFGFGAGDNGDYYRFLGIAFYGISYTLKGIGIAFAAVVMMLGIRKNG